MSDIKITLTKSAPTEDEPVDETPVIVEPTIPGTGTLTLLSSKDGTVTGGNSFGLTVGASAIVLIVAMLYIAAMKSKKRSRGVRFGSHRSHNHKVYYTATKTKAVLSLSTILLIAAVLIPIASQHLNNNDDFVSATSDVLSIITNPIEVSVGLTDSDAITAALSEVSVASATEAGYTLSVYANNVDLVATDENVETKIAGLPESAEPVALSSNTWGLATVEPEDYTSEIWYAIPDSKDNALQVKSVNTATMANDVTTLYYGINVNNELEAGEYIGTINYVAIANVVTDPDPDPDPETAEVTFSNGLGVESTAISIEHEDGSIEGNICAGDAVCNWELKVGETYNISASLAEGYEFDAWTDSAGNGVFGDASSAETTYTVNSATTITPSGRLVIIDIECNPNASTISEVVCMQDIRNGDRAAIFGSMTEGVAYQFYDIRDERQYNIAKLPDGNLWMLDNLALDIASVSLDNLLGETNASNTTLGYLKNGGGTTSDQYANEAVANWTGKEASTSSPLIETGSIDVIPANPDLGNGNHKVGVYYNYCAATAGSYCYEDDALYHDQTTANPVEDICPAGWRLPSGDKDGEYRVLAEAITGKTMETTYFKDDDAALIRTVLSLPFSGEVRALDSTVIFQGQFGGWWSSSRWVGSDQMYSSMSSSTYFYPSTSSTGREAGYTIRCMSTL